MTDLIPEPETTTEHAKSLTEVLAKNEHVKDLMLESAEVLAEVNSGIQQELENTGPLPGVENALEQSVAVEVKVIDASEKLLVINQALEKEIRERILVDHQLAAAQEQEAVARHASMHDVLTGLPNRALFRDRLDFGIAQSKRHDRALAVLFVDLDKFKPVNDTYGHAAGDKLLKTIAQRLTENTRSDDTVARVGGDEFLFLSMEIDDEKNVSLFAAKIIETIEAPCDISPGAQRIDVSVKASVGIAIFPKDGASADELIQSADSAMYRAKQDRSGYCFAAQVRP
jgi:diguanylate cyclase (GGDEF)-like protein